VVLENPRYAAGHLGAADDQSLNKPEYAFQRVLEGCRALFRELGLEAERIPLIATGGIHRPEQLRQLMDWGADGVQMGTAFAVTEEGESHENFKRLLLDAEPKDIVTFMSVAGLPARAVRSPWLDAYLDKDQQLQAVPRDPPCTDGFACPAHRG